MATESGQPRDHALMLEALALAERGRYTTMPNPRVGCVIAIGDEIIGRGWHQRAGSAHAEVLALQEAGTRARGATAYVTLEPCNTSGRTGPCTEQLIAAGIARVVAAVEDPNPEVSGKGLAALRAAGIETLAGICAAQAGALNRGFFKRMRSGRPFVHAKMASSIDGRTAMSSGESQWITGAAARAEVQKMRAQSCVMITGVDTVSIDDPRLTVRSEELGENIGRQPALVIVDSTLRTPPAAQVLSESRASGRRVIIACAAGADAQCAAQLRATGAELQEFSTPASGRRVDLAALLAYLAASEFNEAMLEAGATLFGAFMAADLVDELSLFLAPRLFGQTARPLAALDIADIRDAKGLSIIDAYPVGEDFLLRLAPR
ncbi:MAG: bifunctional diaminohydroxyphosphoribosylaminopyrimidine deaminase/5-amino-6-(5-phosphoribosylamino)uracil reductase RibD [Pseudomonadales bacterium]